MVDPIPTLTTPETDPDKMTREERLAYMEKYTKLEAKMAQVEADYEALLGSQKIKVEKIKLGGNVFGYPIEGGATDGSSFEIFDAGLDDTVTVTAIELKAITGAKGKITRKDFKELIAKKVAVKKPAPAPAPGPGPAPAPGGPTTPPGPIPPTAPPGPAPMPGGPTAPTGPKYKEFLVGTTKLVEGKLISATSKWTVDKIDTTTDPTKPTFTLTIPELETQKTLVTLTITEADLKPLLAEADPEKAINDKAITSLGIKTIETDRAEKKTKAEDAYKKYEEALEDAINKNQRKIVKETGLGKAYRDARDAYVASLPPGPDQTKYLIDAMKAESDLTASHEGITSWLNTLSNHKKKIITATLFAGGIAGYIYGGKGATETLLYAAKRLGMKAAIKAGIATTIAVGTYLGGTYLGKKFRDWAGSTTAVKGIKGFGAKVGKSWTSFNEKLFSSKPSAEETELEAIKTSTTLTGKALEDKILALSEKIRSQKNRRRALKGTLIFAGAAGASFFLGTVAAHAFESDAVPDGGEHPPDEVPPTTVPPAGGGVPYGPNIPPLLPDSPYMDTDHDGIPDFKDMDQDGDGIPDFKDPDFHYGNPVTPAPESTWSGDAPMNADGTYEPADYDEWQHQHFPPHDGDPTLHTHEFPKTEVTIRDGRGAISLIDDLKHKWEATHGGEEMPAWMKNPSRDITEAFHGSDFNDASGNPFPIEHEESSILFKGTKAMINEKGQLELSVNGRPFEPYLDTDGKVIQTLDGKVRMFDYDGVRHAGGHLNGPDGGHLNGPDPIRPDGTYDPAEYQEWLKTHGHVNGPDTTHVNGPDTTPHMSPQQELASLKAQALKDGKLSPDEYLDWKHDAKDVIHDAHKEGVNLDKRDILNDIPTPKEFYQQQYQGLGYKYFSDPDPMGRPVLNEGWNFINHKGVTADQIVHPENYDLDMSKATPEFKAFRTDFIAATKTLSQRELERMSVEKAFVKGSIEVASQ